VTGGRAQGKFVTGGRALRESLPQGAELSGKRRLLWGVAQGQHSGSLPTGKIGTDKRKLAQTKGNWHRQKEIGTDKRKSAQTKGNWHRQKEIGTDNRDFGTDKRKLAQTIGKSAQTKGNWHRQQGN